MPEATVEQVRSVLGYDSDRFSDEEIELALLEAKEEMAMKGVGDAAIPRANYGKLHRLLAASSLLSSHPISGMNLVSSKSEDGTSLTYRSSDLRIDAWSREIADLISLLRNKTSSLIPLYDNYGDIF